MTVQRAVVLLLAGLLSAIAAFSLSGYRVARTFFIGGAGAWDYATVDPVGRRLYVSHGVQVEVIDLHAGKLIHTIPNTLGARGIAVAPELGRGFVACNKTDSILVFDLGTFQAIQTVRTDPKPDAVVYDTATGLVLAFTHNKSATVFQAKDGTLRGKIPLGGGPEFAVADGKGTVFVSLQDTNEVAQIDPQRLHLERPWPVKSCQAATSLGMDRRARRLFVGCHNRTLAVMDADNGQTLQTLPIGPGVDGTVFDDDTQLAFVSSGGNGTATIIHEDAADHFSVVDIVKTRPSARTIALDPQTHTLYLPFARIASAAKAGAEEKFEEDTFAVLEVRR